MLAALLLLMAGAVSISLASLFRRRDPGQRGYVAIVAAVLMLLVVATVRGDRFLGVVALGFGFVVVVAPWLLDLLVRACFARERLAWAVRFARWRVLLMPGAGLGRQQEILEGLSILERKGVDGAVAHFRGLVQRSEDELELRVLHEQIVSMLLYGQRWDDGIAHYEARFPPTYAAQRPPLALGLLRAYGESGKLDRAAALLRSIETRLGVDPRAAGVVSQARLTFLAYAGEDDPVTAALTEPRRRRLGLSPANVALFRGIALSRAGKADAASSELRRVEDVARARDERVVHASRKAIAALPGDAVELEPELHEYATVVAERLESFLAVTPVMRRAGPLRVTPLLMVMLVAGFLGVLALDRGGAGLLAAGGATPSLILGGSPWRVLTGLVIQTDMIELLLSLYGVWLAGPLVERVLGRGRLVVVSVGAGAAGLAMAAVADPSAMTVVAGASLLTAGVFVAALWIVASPRTDLPRRTRRVLSLPLLLLLLAMGLSVTRTSGLVLSPAGLAAAVVVGGLGAWLAPPNGWRHRIGQVLAGVLSVGFVAAFVMVGLEDSTAALTERPPSRKAAGLTFAVPSSFEVVERAESGARRSEIPVVPGLLDTLALQVGDQVQVVVTETAPDEGSMSALLRIEPSLSHEVVEARGTLPPKFEAALRKTTRDPDEPLAITTIRRNGHDVALVVEREVVKGDDATAIVLIAAPPRALEHMPDVYAQILVSAQREPG